VKVFKKMLYLFILISINQVVTTTLFSRRTKPFAYKKYEAVPKKCPMFLEDRQKNCTVDNIRRTFDDIDDHLSEIRVKFVSRMLTPTVPPMFVAQALCEQNMDMRNQLLDAIAELSSNERESFLGKPNGLDTTQEIKSLEHALLAGTGKEIRGVIGAILAIDRVSQSFYECDRGLNQKLADVQQVFVNMKDYWFRGMEMDPEDVKDLKMMDLLRTEAIKTILNKQLTSTDHYVRTIFCPAVHETLLILGSQLHEPLSLHCSLMSGHFDKLEALLAALTDPKGKCWSYYQCGRADCSKEPTSSSTLIKEEKLFSMSLGNNPDKHFRVVLGDQVISRVLLSYNLYYEPRSSYRSSQDVIREMKRDKIINRPLMDEMLDLSENVQKVAAVFHHKKDSIQQHIQKKTVATEEEKQLFSTLAVAQGYVSFRGRKQSDTQYWNGAYAEAGSCRIAGTFLALAHVGEVKKFGWSPIDETIPDPTRFNSTYSWTLKILDTPTSVSSIYRLRNKLNEADLVSQTRRLSEDGLEDLLTNTTDRLRNELEAADAMHTGHIIGEIFGMRHLFRSTNELCNGDLILQAWQGMKAGTKHAWMKFKKFFLAMGHRTKWSYLNQKLKEVDREKQHEKIARRMIYEKTLQVDSFGDKVLCPIIFDTLKKELDKPMEQIDAAKAQVLVSFLRDSYPAFESPPACMYFYWCGNSTCNKGPGLEGYNWWTKFENMMGDLLWTQAEKLQEQTDAQMHVKYDINNDKIPMVARWENRARKWQTHYKNITDWTNEDHFIHNEKLDDCKNITTAVEDRQYKCFLPYVLGDQELTEKLIAVDAYLDPRMMHFSADYKRFTSTQRSIHRYHVDLYDFTTFMNVLAFGHVTYIITLGSIVFGVPLQILTVLHLAEMVDEDHNKMEILFGKEGACSMVRNKVMDFVTGVKNSMQRLPDKDLVKFASLHDDDLDVKEMVE